MSGETFRVFTSIIVYFHIGAGARLYFRMYYRPKNKQTMPWVAIAAVGPTTQVKFNMRANITGVNGLT